MLASFRLTVEKPVGNAVAVVAVLPRFSTELAPTVRVVPDAPVMLNAVVPFDVLSTPPPVIVRLPVRFVAVRFF